MSSKSLIFISILITTTLIFFNNIAISPSKAIIEPLFLEEDIFRKNSINKIKVPKKYITIVTGYSSTPDETDDTPFETASGDYVKDGIVAANFLPLGTKIKIEKLFGDKIFIVKDRMNKRYQNRIDIWFPSKEKALLFGIHFNIEIEILD